MPKGEAIFDRKAAGSTQHAKTFGEACARAVAILRHPRQRQAGLGQRLPERCLPVAFLVAVDGLRVGEIGKYLFRGFGDNVLTLRHSVPRFHLAHISPGHSAPASDAIFSCFSCFSCTG